MRAADLTAEMPANVWNKGLKSCTDKKKAGEMDNSKEQNVEKDKETDP